MRRHSERGCQRSGPDGMSAEGPAAAVNNTLPGVAEFGDMPTATLKLQEEHRQPSGAVAVAGIRTEDHAAFREFVDRHHHLMRDYLDRRLRGAHDVSAED